MAVELSDDDLEELMKSLTTYLTFDGTCREAMTFYAKCLGGDLLMMPASEAPGKPMPGAENKIMHARISKGGSVVLMASDSMHGTVQAGYNFSISIDCDSEAEIDSLFAALGEGGKVTVPLADAFWGARFGMLIDQFGIQWMFNFEKPKA